MSTGYNPWRYETSTDRTCYFWVLKKLATWEEDCGGKHLERFLHGEELGKMFQSESKKLEIKKRVQGFPTNSTIFPSFFLISLFPHNEEDFTQMSGWFQNEAKCVFEH